MPPELAQGFLSQDEQETSQMRLFISQRDKEVGIVFYSTLLYKYV